jgi:Uma2 family endonuclease
MAVEARKRLFTVDDYYRMGEVGIFDPDDRLELLGGEIFVMPPIGVSHASVVDRLNTLLTARLAGRAIVRVQNPVRLDDLSEPLPDLAILHEREDFYRSHHPTPPEVHFLIEVMDTSGMRDRRDKLPRYAAAGVGEVWLVDLPASRIELYRDPRGDSYETVAMVGPSEMASPAAFPDIVLAVSEILVAD